MSGRRTSPTTLQERVAQNLVALRYARGMQLKQLADALTERGFSINASNVIRLERVERAISVDELAIIADVFGVTPWSLTDVVDCKRCQGTPPEGFACTSCGAIGGQR